MSANEKSVVDEKEKLNDDEGNETNAESSKTDTDDQQQQQQYWLSASALWGSSWLKSAKEKTYTTLELMKKDLSEFGDAFTNEATAIATTTVESVKHQAHALQQIVTTASTEQEDEDDDDDDDDGDNDDKSTTSVSNPQQQSTNLPPPPRPPLPLQQKEKAEDGEVQNETENSSISFGWAPKLPQLSTITTTSSSWMKSLVDTVKSIAQEDTTSDEDQHTEIIMPKSADSNLVKKRSLSHCILYEIQTNRETYIKEPEGDAHLYELWQNDFTLSNYDHQMNELLKNCPPMRALYQELVPSVVDNQTFWKRYFYKVHQAETMEHYKKGDTLSTLLNVATELSDSNRASSPDKSKMKHTSESNEQSSQDGHSNNDETWSVCSSTNIEIQEIHDGSEQGSQTPKATYSLGTSPDKNDKSSDSWVDWEE